VATTVSHELPRPGSNGCPLIARSIALRHFGRSHGNESGRVFSRRLRCLYFRDLPCGCQSSNAQSLAGRMFHRREADVRHCQLSVRTFDPICRAKSTRYARASQSTVKSVRTQQIWQMASSRSAFRLRSMDIIDGAAITIRRAILARFRPGPERERWLAWLRAAYERRKAEPHR
jgi:hypothetical protein